MPEIAFRSISKIYPDGTSAVDALDLVVGDGEFLCILGPSGCGKSSTLRMLAGLELVTTGDLLLDGRRINDEPPRARDMAMVFENYALYPHLDVYHNIAMPLVARGVPRAEIRRRVVQTSEMLRLREHLDKRPQALSGGQRQRVALGRALVRSPKIFLMDEPLGHLEAYLRVELRAEIRRLHEERHATTVYITHDQQEAGAVADRIAVMNAGRLQQVGSLVELLDRPVNRFVATFVGELPINLLPATVVAASGAAALRIGDVLQPLAPMQAAHLAAAGSAQAELTVGTRPENVEIVDPELSAALRGTVALVEPQGDTTIVLIDTATGRISAVVDSVGAPQPGTVVGVRLAMPRSHVFAADGTNLFAGLGTIGGG